MTKGRIITSCQTGKIEDHQCFGPYGERMENRSSDNTYRPLTGYTGHIQTDDTGLIYMTRARPVPAPFGRQWPCSPFRPHRQSWRWVRGRCYSPSWHRFVNSDQGVAPSSWNQFAYVDGRSFLATDPSGRVAEAPSWGGFRTVVVWGEASDVEFMDVWDWFQQEALQLFPELDHGRVGPTGDSSGDGRGGGGGGGDKPQTQQAEPCAVSLGFNISSGNLTINVNHPSLTMSIPATSGRGDFLNNPAGINMFKQGPLPLGSYMINVGELSTSYTDPLKVAVRNWFGDWGSFRVPLHPEFDMPAGRTGDFLLHGGSTPGSEGCIDCGGGRNGNAATNALIFWLRQDSNGRVPCTVTK